MSDTCQEVEAVIAMHSRASYAKRAEEAQMLREAADRVALALARASLAETAAALAAHNRMCNQLRFIPKLYAYAALYSALLRLPAPELAAAVRFAREIQYPAALRAAESALRRALAELAPLAAPTPSRARRFLHRLTHLLRRT